MDQPTPADPYEYGERIADVYDQWFPASAEQLTPMVDFLARHAAGGHPVEIRYAWPSELDLMAELAGLEPLGRWGGWRDEPFTSASTAHVSAWVTSPR